eukprot:4432330-Prymnesium_polylepis.1
MASTRCQKRLHFVGLTRACYVHVYLYVNGLCMPRMSMTMCRLSHHACVSEQCVACVVTGIPLRAERLYTSGTLL